MQHVFSPPSLTLCTLCSGTWTAPLAPPAASPVPPPHSSTHWHCPAQQPRVPTTTACPGTDRMSDFGTGARMFTSTTGLAKTVDVETPRIARSAFQSPLPPPPPLHPPGWSCKNAPLGPPTTWHPSCCSVLGTDRRLIGGHWASCCMSLLWACRRSTRKNRRTFLTTSSTDGSDGQRGGMRCRTSAAT